MTTTVRLKAALVENIYVAVGFTATVLFVLVLLLPSLSSIPSISTQLTTKSSELKELREKSAVLNSLLANQSSLKSSLKIVETAIPSKDNVPTLMTQIQRIATDSGVTIRALQFGAPALTTATGGSNQIAADKTIKRIMLQAVAEGSFANLQSFLRNVENASRLITVESINFESKRSGPGLGSTLGLAAYFIDTLPVNVSSAIDFASPQLKNTLLRLKALKVYEAEVTFSATGKANPFE